MPFFDFAESTPPIPYTGTLTSFGSQAAGKAVKRANFTLEGNYGSGWATLSSDKYRVRHKMGAVELRDVDSSDNDIDWSAYMDYQEDGNVAFRATYTVKTQGGTTSTYTTETVTISEADPYFPFTESGEIDGEFPQNLWVDEIHAEYGDIGGFEIDSDSIEADTGKLKINSATPYISLGATVTDYFSGTGFWVGKHSSDWKFHIGNPSGEYMRWTGTELDHTGDHADTGTIGGRVNGWKIRAGYILSKNDKVRIDATSQYFAAGATVPTSYGNNAGIWIGYDSSVAKMSLYTDSNNYLQYNGSVLTWKAANTSLDSSGNLTASSATLSGAITATSGTISGNLLVTGTLQNSATSNLGYKLNSTGLHIYNSSNAQTVEINADGSGWFGVTGTRALEWTTAGAVSIGDFDIGADYLRDAANTFGLASTVTGGNDVRFWAGDSFANRASASLQIYEDGYIFAKDIVLAKGNLSGASGVTGYGYAVGDPLLLLHFDGAKPFETDTRGSLIGHKGQAGTYTFDPSGTPVVGRGVFRPGKFNKAVQIAEATTNLCTNPSFESDATTSWSNSGTWATNAQSSEQAYTGTYSNKLVNSSGSDAFRYTTFTATVSTSTVSIWVYRSSGSGTITLYLQQNFAPFTVIASTTASATTGVWQRLVVSGATTATSSYRLNLGSATGVTLYIDSAQIESKSYVTPYCDGYLSAEGHSWSGTEYLSSSSRTTSVLTYPASGNINLAQGTLSYWFYMPSSNTTPCYDFGIRIDANNYLNVRHIFAAARTPVAASAQGGSGVDTSSGASTAAVDTWHHVVVTWTTGALKLYLNGVQSGATATYAVPTGTPSTIEIGTFNSTQFSNTLIDDVCILNHVLTLNEIKSIYYSEAPLMTGISNQEFRLAGAATGDVFGNANGLFARGADGTPSFALLNATVNATTWGGASESFDAGDFMFGSNKSSKSNLFWDASAGQLKFRGATTTQLYIDTDGTLNFGGGAQKLNADGFTISISESYSLARAITWKDGTDVVTSIYMEGSLSLGYEDLHIEVTSPSSRDANIWLVATPGSGASDASVVLDAGGTTYTFSALQSAIFDQGTIDSTILEFHSSDVGHGMTTVIDTNAFGSFAKVDGASGGLEIIGLKDADGANGNAMRLRGYLGETADTTKSTSGNGIVSVSGSIKSGTSAASASGTANANIFAILDHNTTRAIFDVEGDLHLDATSNNTVWDDYDDVALIESYRVLTANPNFKRAFAVDIQEHAEILARTGVITLNDDGHHFASVKGLFGLGFDAMRQMDARIRELERQLAVKRLTA